MADENLDVKLALEEMRFNMQQSLSAGDALDQKTNLVLAAAAVVIAVGTTLQISLEMNRSDLYWMILLLSIGLYLAAVGAALWGSRPQTYRLAIASDWSELNRQLFNKSEREAILALLSGYVDQIQHNQRINAVKAKRLQFSLLVLALTVPLLISLVFIP